jgi:hypothetical protein
MRKLQFKVPPEEVEKLDELQELTATSTRKEFLNDALTLYEWAIEQKRLGREVGSWDDERVYPLVMTKLSRVEQDKEPTFPGESAVQNGSTH